MHPGVVDSVMAVFDDDAERKNMTKLESCFRAYLAAVVMLATVPAEAANVKELKGQAPVTLKAGQTFYEGPTDVHVVGRNASNTAPARFVVVLLKRKGTPILTPVNE